MTKPTTFTEMHDRWLAAKEEADRRTREVEACYTVQRDLKARLAEAERLQQELSTCEVDRDRYAREANKLEARLAEAKRLLRQAQDTCSPWTVECIDAYFADQPSAADEIPLCAGHADWWFTSRNHLATDRCVVCAFETTDKGTDD